MSIIKVLLHEKGCNLALHQESGARVETDTPPEFGGGGSSFSSTDLVAAALGTCIASSLAPLADREQIPRDTVHLLVRKTLALSPKRIEQLHVTIHVAAALTATQQKKLLRAAQTCTVKRSLHPDIDVVIELRPPNTP